MRVIGLQLLLVSMLLPLDTRQRCNIQAGARPGAQYTEFAANIDRNGTGRLHLCERYHDPDYFAETSNSPDMPSSLSLAASHDGS
jgi:hypothetical protein